MSLRLEWVSQSTAKRAVLKWHYSRTMPVAKAASLGVWEHGRFIGVVVFSHGANFRIGCPFQMRVGQVIELVRVALASHQAPVSRILSIATRMMLKSSPGVELVISYADPVQGHVGTIYQASNWVYLGMTAPSFEYRWRGQRLHKRAFTGHNFSKPRKQLPDDAQRVRTPGKHIYARPITGAARVDIEARRQAYPKAPVEHEYAPVDQIGDRGLNPTDGLQQ